MKKRTFYAALLILASVSAEAAPGQALHAPSISDVSSRVLLVQRLEWAGLSGVDYGSHWSPVAAFDTGSSCTQYVESKATDATRDQFMCRAVTNEDEDLLARQFLPRARKSTNADQIK